MPRKQKAIKDLKSLARTHTEKAIATLAGIMNSTKSPEANRIAAANSLLDRGWGKATQPIAGDDEAPPIQITEVAWTIVKAGTDGT